MDMDSSVLLLLPDDTLPTKRHCCIRRPVRREYKRRRPANEKLSSTRSTGTSQHVVSLSVRRLHEITTKVTVMIVFMIIIMNVCKNVEGFQVSSSVWLRNTILHQRHCYHRYSLDVDSALSLSNRHWSDDPNHQRRRDMIVTTVPPAKPPTLYDNNSDDPSNANNGKNIYPITPRRIEPNRIQRTPEKYQFQQPDIERQISLAGRQGRTDDALRLFYSITQPPPPKDQHLQPPKILLPTIRQLNAVIDACARARPVRLTTALEIVNTYTTATIPPNTNNTKQNVVPSSPSTSAVRKLEPNVYTYGSLMNAISRSGDIDLALQVLQYMQSPHSTVRPNVVVYQSAISAAANAARPDISLQLLEDAQKNHVPITVIGYNAAITAAARANQYTLAMDLLRQMQSDPTLPQPDIVTYGTVMAACEYGNQWQLVLQFAEEIENSTATIKNATDAATVGDHSRPNISLDGMAITSALKACQQLGYASLALHYLDRMKSLTNNNITQSNSYTVTSGRERIGSKQPLLGPDAVAYRLAISACARGGAWEDGIRLLDEYCATVNDQDVVAYTAAITGCEYAGRWVEAVQLLVRMRQVANVQPNVVTFAAVIGACATVCAQMMTDPVAATNKNNNNNHLNGAMPLPQKKALQILNVMKKNPNVVDPNIQVYNAAIRTCAEAMDIKGAFQVYQMIKDDVHQIEPNVITYGTLMLACERVGSMKGMDQVFAQMRHDQIRPNEIIYGTAISCCRKADEKERAYALLNKMIQDGYHPNVATINTVLIAQTENFKSNSSSGMKSSNTDLDRAIQIFKNFFLPTTTTAAATPAPIQPSRQTYSIMIRAFSSNQRPKDAEALLRRMRTVDGLIPDVDLYTITVSAYERIGQPLNALRLMESMREDGYDFYDVEVLNTLFKRLVKLVSAVGQTFGKATGKSSDNSTTII